VRRGDVILAVDGQPIADSNALRNRIASTKPGTSVALNIVRDGHEQTLTATLGELAAVNEDGATVGKDHEGGSFGLAVETLTRELARQLEVNITSGVVVNSVAPDSAASDAGIRPGDVIEQVDGKPVADVDALRSALTAKVDRPALVLVHRKNQSMFLTLKRG
jgi:serine protease Do